MAPHHRSTDHLCRKHGRTYGAFDGCALCATERQVAEQARAQAERPPEQVRENAASYAALFPEDA